MINVGWKPILIVVGVLVVGLISYFTIQYIQESTQDKTTIEILEETNQRREGIRNEIRNSKPADRNDATDSLQYFKSRQGNSD